MDGRDTVSERFEAIWHDLKNAVSRSSSPPSSREELSARMGKNAVQRLREFVELSEILRDLYNHPRAPSFPLTEKHISPLTNSSSFPSGTDFACVLAAVAKKYEEEYGTRSEDPVLRIGPSGPRADLALALRHMDPSDISPPTDAADATLVVWSSHERLSASLSTALSPIFQSQEIRGAVDPSRVLRLLYAASPKALVCIWRTAGEVEIFTDPRCPSPDGPDTDWAELPTSPTATIRKSSVSTLLTDLLPPLLESLQDSCPQS